MKGDFLTLILSAMLLYGCNKSVGGSDENNINYFERGELSKDRINDSVRNHLFTKTLRVLEEPSLRESKTYSLRVTLLSSYYNPYTIRVERNGSIAKVIFKFKGDDPNFVRAGLSSLNLTYTSSHVKMDSLVDNLFQKVNEYDFYPGFDDAEFDATDGFSYLLEYSHDNKYKVVEGWNGGDYRGKKEFFGIVRKMHAFVPDGFVPNLRKARALKDGLFPIFRRDSIPEIN